MSPRIRVLADENFRLAIVDGLRRLQPSIDIWTVNDAGISGMEDPLVLQFAADQSRVLLSHDVNTMPLHFKEFLDQGHQSPGLILLPQLIGYREAIEALNLVWEASGPSDWINVLDFFALVVSWCNDDRPHPL